MSLDYVHRAIGDRTPFTGQHKPSPFDSTWEQTLRLLTDELGHLHAENVIIELDVVPAQIRNDGRLREGSRVVSPATRLTFDSMHGSLTYATDRFVRNYKGPRDDWRHNVRAIALGLEALRKVDRYGVAQHGEQYTGYLALEAGTGATALGGITKDAAAATLALHGNVPADEILEHIEAAQAAFKTARAHVHPDRAGGSRDDWDAVEAAAKVLGVLK